MQRLSIMTRLFNSQMMLATLAVIALVAPALVNGTAFLFPDSIGYFHAGEASLNTLLHWLVPAAGPPGAGQAGALDLDTAARNGISTARSVYYGIPFVLLYRIGDEWALVLAQALVMVLVLALAARRLAIPPAWQWLLLLLLLVSGLSLYTSAAMPDVFAGIAILALAFLLDASDTMPRAERWTWLALLLLSCLFHKAILAIVVVMLGLGVLAEALSGRQWGRLAPPAAMLGLAMIGHAAVNMAVTRLSGAPPVQTPFALARIVGDGTAYLYLKRHCPAAGFELCKHLDRFPMTENIFLWSHDPQRGVMNALPLAARRQISNEADALVMAAVSAFPLHQLQATLRGFGGQLMTVGVTEYALGPGASADPSLVGLISRHRLSLAGQQRWPFIALSSAMTLAYLATLFWLAGLLAVAGRRDARRQRLDLAVVGWIVIGLAANAAVCGMVAGVFDRYQGRVAWLVPLAAVAVAVQLGRRRAQAALS
jgi:hypothetical protein